MRPQSSPDRTKPGVKRNVIPVMVLTTERVVIALIAFGALYLLQSRSRKISDDFLRKVDQRRGQTANLELERQRAQEYEQFELKNEIAQRDAASDQTEGESKGDVTKPSGEVPNAVRSYDGGMASGDDSGRSVDVAASTAMDAGPNGSSSDVAADDATE